MKVVYVSTLISQKKLDYILDNAKLKPLQSIQKFNRLICEGLTLNECKVDVISSIPMSRKIMNKYFWFNKKEKEDGINYKYIPFINIKIIRQIMLAINLVFILMKESFNKEKKVFVCDILNTTISSITLLYCKIFKKKCITIVTDLPRDINSSSISSKINQFFQSKYDGYIFITEAMNNIINKKNKPYIVMECIVDNNIEKESQDIIKNDKKVLLYAGGLYEKYGIKNLIDAVKQIENKKIELHLYGSGDVEDYIKKMNSDRIKYFGVKPNKEIIIAEQQATLLVNPRFTKDEYTKYSFPSKIMEYMISGTPTLTTKLSGIPQEYYKYIFTFNDESVLGMKTTIEEILSKDKKIIQQKGINAQKYVLENKNKRIQGYSIKRFLEKI